MLTPTRTLLLATILTLGGTTWAQAQVTVGPRVGLNLANVSYKTDDKDDEPDTKLLISPQAGITLNAAFGNLALQPSLLFSQKGFKVKESDNVGPASYEIESNTRLNYLELPVNLVYTTGGTEGFQVFAGPYIGVGLGGKQKSTYTVSGPGIDESGSETTKIKFAGKEKDNSDDFYINQPDYGFNGGIGYKKGPIQAQLGYSLGLNTLVSKDSDGKRPDDIKVHNRVIQFSLSYFFGS
ncbi:porin family protein [Hymenobacter aerophilus]|uniref:porin family protein n=1 Tax=Hymenobacter aerophilus TaxID=119644 RepID=UPI00036632C5|nr:porin family protein [Hymenobacter aerophilus]